ncbi:hypothetical protein C4565_04175 [Candidatus Parcubacteria bacterium]|jgi:hypothetical protein|nr:MAG: hypothetical protein C4565_04175 [Candidatus Parcubacteria bacterium]
MDEKLKLFVMGHGNAFHSRVISKLRTLGWSVMVSPFYRDNATGKAREADIIAEKEVKFGMDGNSNASNGFFLIRLVIECKYVKDPIIFWFDKKDATATEERIIKDISIFQNSKKNTSIKKHHWYESEEAAKLFATFNQNKEERQFENEIIFSSVDKVLNCLINYRSKPSIITSPISPDHCFYKKLNPIIITYPIIILDSFSKLYRTEISSQTDQITNLNGAVNFDIEVNYEYEQGIFGGEHPKVSHHPYLSIRVKMPGETEPEEPKTWSEYKNMNFEYFLLDVTCIEKLDDYLEKLKNKDLRAALNFV